MGQLDDKEHIIWDWNGTLINDVTICLGIINRLLDKYELKPVSVDEYRQAFSFPVKSYYKKLGFDFSKIPYEQVAHEFIALYLEASGEASLAKDARNALTFFNERNRNQYVLSAMEQQALNQAIQHHHIAEYFDQVYGIRDHYAHGKADLGRQFMEAHRLDASRSIFIGDTLHDYEVASAMGIDCILVASGHQSFERLKHSGTKVVHSLEEITGMLE